MKSTLPVLIALLAAGGCTTPSPPPGELDRLLPVARREAMRRFHEPEARLRFWSLDCRYGPKWVPQDATQPLDLITFTFFDPDSVRPATNGQSGHTAVAYHIGLSTNGEYRRSSHGRGIGWSP